MTAIGASSFTDNSSSPIKTAIGRVSVAPTEDTTKPGSSEETKKKKSDEADTAKGKKATGQAAANLATTVKPYSADQQASKSAVDSTTQILQGTQDKNWQEGGARPPTATELQQQAQDQASQGQLTSLPGFPEVNGTDRNQILGNFNELQNQFNTQDPNNLVGNPGNPEQFASAQVSQFGGQALFGSGNGPLNGGGAPIVVNSQAVAVANSGPSVSSGPVVEQTVVETPPPADKETNPVPPEGGNGFSTNFE